MFRDGSRERSGVGGVPRSGAHAYPWRRRLPRAVFPAGSDGLPLKNLGAIMTG